MGAAAEKIAPDGFDVVCDANGIETLKKSYNLSYLSSRPALAAVPVAVAAPR